MHGVLIKRTFAKLFSLNKVFIDNKHYNINTMKKIVDYRKLLGVTEAAELQELKSTYRGLNESLAPG
jgi:hypothetical protein